MAQKHSFPHRQWNMRAAQRDANKVAADDSRRASSFRKRTRDETERKYRIYETCKNRVRALRANCQIDCRMGSSRSYRLERRVSDSWSWEFVCVCAHWHSSFLADAPQRRPTFLLALIVLPIGLAARPATRKWWSRSGGLVSSAVRATSERSAQAGELWHHLAPRQSNPLYSSSASTHGNQTASYPFGFSHRIRMLQNYLKSSHIDWNL